MKTLQALAIGTLLGAVGLFSAADARSDNSLVRASNATNAPDDQIEFVTSPDRIKNVASNGAPMAIWEALEHGEKVECLDCIAAVEPLLYDQNARTREIAAWWLRRRILGVFGSGEVYERTVQTLAGDASPQRRAYAAYALGELLAPPGVTACATALTKDTDGGVRAAAASARGRLNDLRDQAHFERGGLDEFKYMCRTISVSRPFRGCLLSFLILKEMSLIAAYYSSWYF